MCPHDADIEGAVAGWRQGDQDAVDDLFRLVYHELRILARRHLRRHRPGHTLGPTALVHEVYLRFAQRSSQNLLDRHHFVALAARAVSRMTRDFDAAQRSFYRTFSTVNGGRAREEDLVEGIRR
jgi:hypothetical protein